ncbi:MAG TPA: hypothetical protein VGK19_22765 [Capsulimonadaceae bacterium]|jgi:hypothetical protein
MTTATTPRTRRLRIAAIVTATLAALAAALYVIDTRTDAISCGLRIPAKLDASTPAKQGGFELMGITRGRKDHGWEFATADGKQNAYVFAEAGDSELGIKCLWRPPVPGAELPGWDGKFHVTGRASTGSCFPLSFSTTDQINGKSIYHESTYGHPQNDAPLSFAPVIAIHIPGSYPKTYRWIDVTIESSDGHKACWRISRLPRTHRSIPAKIDDATTVTVANGVSVAATAQMYSESSSWCDVTYKLSPHAGPKGETWQFTQLSGLAHTEWETRDAELDLKSINPSKDIGGLTRSFSSLKTITTGACGNFGPYPEARHASFIADLTRVALLEETLEFPVTKAALGESGESFIAETRSGVRVKLSLASLDPPEQRAWIKATPGSGSDSFFTNAPFVRPIKSYLVSKYGKPVQIAVAMPGYYPAETQNLKDGTFSVSFGRQRPSANKVLVLVRQRVILERIPVSFTFDRLNMPPAIRKATRTP